LMVTWIGALPCATTLGRVFFLSYVARIISSIYSIAHRSSTSSSSLSNPSLSTMSLFLLSIVY
jgi:hypothetical protein